MKFITSFVLGVLFCAITWIGLFYSLLGHGTFASQGLFETLQKKTELMHQSPSPRVILLGGSGTLMGLGADLLSRELGLPTINFGTFAGFDIRYQLDVLEPLLKSGDTLILNWEYESYCYDGRVSAETLQYIFERDSKYYLSQNWISQLKQVYQMNGSDLVQSLISKLLPSSKRKRRYPTELVNEFGDQTVNRLAPVGKNSQESLATLGPIELGPVCGNSEALKELIADLAKKMNKKGINLMATWPATISFKEYENSKYRSFFESIKGLYQKNSVPVLGKPEEYFYDQGFFFDTRYHLNKRGVERRTLALVKILRSLD
jgi:hypothetical protein